MQPSTVQPPTQMQQTPLPQPRACSEGNYGVIFFRRIKSIGRWDSYTGVVTSQRLIFAQITNEMIKTAAHQSRDQTKAEGKVFWVKGQDT